MKVAVDATPLWGSVTGVGWYLHSVLHAMAEEPDLHLLLFGPLGEEVSVAPPQGSAIEFVHFPLREDLSLPPGLLRQALRLLVPYVISRHEPDVLFAPNFFLPRRFGATSGPQVAMVHDLASIHFGWTLADDTALALKKELEKSIRQARYVLTPSETVRSELVELELAPAEKVVAIHHGPGHLASQRPPDSKLRSSLEALGAEGDYVLSVGTLEPRKNLKVLLEAWQMANDSDRGLPRLVLCGARGWKDDDLKGAFSRGIEQGWLLLPGYVSDEQLEHLYFGASVVVQASLYEGFGLPLVEAMAAGCPLVCSDIGVFREVVGDAGLYADAEEPAAWVEAVLGALEPEMAEELVSRGRKRVVQFDWTRCGAETLRVLREACDR